MNGEPQSIVQLASNSVLARVAIFLSSGFHYRFVLYGVLLAYFVVTLRRRNLKALIAAFQYDVSPFLKAIFVGILLAVLVAVALAVFRHSSPVP